MHKLANQILEQLNKATGKNCKLLPYDKAVIEEDVIYILFTEISKTSDHRYKISADATVQMGSLHGLNLSMDILDFNLNNQEAKAKLKMYENGFYGMTSHFHFMVETGIKSDYKIMEVKIDDNYGR